MFDKHRSIMDILDAVFAPHKRAFLYREFWIHHDGSASSQVGAFVENQLNSRLSGSRVRG